MAERPGQRLRRLCRTAHLTSPPPALFLAGPTGVGKSAVALQLAEALDGEILSVDSMQVYQGMDIGTSKPTAAERARIRHHLLDVVPLSQAFDAAQFVQRARAAVEEIRQRRRVPIFCGGTGLYFQAYLQGLGNAPGSSPALRAQLEQRSLEDLLVELSQLDPAAYARLDRRNKRRVIRALEVVRLSGRSVAAQRALWTPPRVASPSANPAVGIAFFGLLRAKEDLRGRIDARVQDMFGRGLIAEVLQLLSLGLRENRTALQAIGYRQVVEHLDGNLSLADTQALVQRKTRQYARRQMTWFRRYAEIEWLEVGREEPSENIASRLITRYLQVPGASTR